MQEEVKADFNAGCWRTKATGRLLKAAGISKYMGLCKREKKLKVRWCRSRDAPDTPMAKQNRQAALLIGQESGSPGLIWGHLPIKEFEKIAGGGRWTMW